MSKTKQRYSIDLFSGCGGLSLGLAQAGIKPLAFSEINQDAADTFELNLGSDEIRRYGDVTQLSASTLKQLMKEWDAAKTHVDLVVGGPPCQGYSGIGHRRSYHVEKKAIPFNHLFKQMIRVIKIVQPKLFLFENVRGLLSGRWSPDGERGEIWDDVRDAFQEIDGYEIGWKLVHAKDFGVPQNRPRILLVGARRDIVDGIEEGDPSNREDNSRGLIPKGTGKAPDILDVLSDLDDPKFSINKVNPVYLFEPKSEFQIRIRRSRGGRIKKRGAVLTEQEYSKHSDETRKKFLHMLANNGVIPKDLQTRKFAQRVLPRRWGQDGPTITTTSLPDDFVHYAHPRILTVREWARLQTFPDWFQFCGPRTTGGLRRAGQPMLGIWEREVPKYTQIGNAIPVTLARAVGRHLQRLLDGK
jgi:DNA (cytosine-5)-methyltransferase 1